MYSVVCQFPGSLLPTSPPYTCSRQSPLNLIRSLVRKSVIGPKITGQVPSAICCLVADNLWTCPAFFGPMALVGTNGSSQQKVFRPIGRRTNGFLPDHRHGTLANTHTHQLRNMKAAKFAHNCYTNMNMHRINQPTNYFITIINTILHVAQKAERKVPRSEFV